MGKDDKIDLTDANTLASYEAGKAAGYREKDEGFFHQTGLTGHILDADDAFWAGHKSGEAQREIDDRKSSGDSGGGSCYITSACVEALGLPDNCFDLRILRWFRDNVLLPVPSAKRAVGEYYKVAPEVVQAIQETEYPLIVWQPIATEIKKAVTFVLQGNFQAAFEHYRETTLKIKKQFGI